MRKEAASPFIFTMAYTGAYQVIHRASGRYLGWVSHWRYNVGRRSIVTPWIVHRRGYYSLREVFRTRLEAAQYLMVPEAIRPDVYLWVCRVCQNANPAPEVCPTGKCDTAASAEARARRVDPSEWRHYDWVLSMVNEATLGEEHAR